jgi:hypothetical protein
MRSRGGPHTAHALHECHGMRGDLPSPGRPDPAQAAVEAIMKAFRVLLFAMLLGTVTTSLAAAHSNTPRADRREARQSGRIRQGVRSGELTPGEAARLRAGQAHVRGVERRAKSDGVVTLRERAKLERVQDRQSRKIHRLKHNGRSR